jgi:hypothetical protein
VGMAVHDQVRAVLEDRGRETVAAEEDEDLGGLAHERRRNWCVVKDHDSNRAGRDLVQAGVERRHLRPGLGVDGAQRGLAEVGKVGRREAADEALGADHADLSAMEVQPGRAPFEDDDPPATRRSAISAATPVCQSWLPSTAQTGVSTCAAASTRISASSGLPSAVRSPASRARSACPSRAAKPARTWSRFLALQWTSPAAATRTGGCCWESRSGIAPALPG